MHRGPGTLRQGQGRNSGEARTQALDRWGAVRRRRAAKALSQAPALQPFAGTVKALPTESGMARLAAVQGGGSQS